MEDLPADILGQMFGYLQSQDLQNVSLVTRSSVFNLTETQPETRVFSINPTQT